MAYIAVKKLMGGFAVDWVIPKRATSKYTFII
jgi:hypothetical protein